MVLILERKMNDNVSLHLVETPSKHMKEQCDAIQYDRKGDRKSNRGIIFLCYSLMFFVTE